MIKNTENMVKFKQNDSVNKKKRVLDVLNALIEENKSFTKADICRLSSVSKNFLYTHKEELLIPIDLALENYNKKRMNDTRNISIFSDKSSQTVIDSLKRKIEKLETENKELKKERDILYGKLATKK